MRRKDKKGYLLVEAMVAVTVTSIGLLSIIGLLSRSVSLNRVAVRRATASYLAAEGVEIVKNIIDSNVITGLPWNQGFAADGDWEADFNSLSFEPFSGRAMLFDQSSGFYSYDSGGETPYVRKISVSLVSSDEIKVHSVVSWRDLRGAELTVDLEDYFFNWRIMEEE